MPDPIALSLTLRLTLALTQVMRTSLVLAATFSGTSDEFGAARAFIGVWGSGPRLCTRQLAVREADWGWYIQIVGGKWYQ